MKRIAFVVYRKWAYEIYENILAFQGEQPGFEIGAIITVPSAEFALDHIPNLYVVEGNDNERIASLLSEKKIDAVCYYGWSWLVKEPILSDFVCLCLHPSPLPKYRGGSPLQNQIILGEENSAVSVFKIGEGLDDGPLYAQLPMSLAGTLEDVFARMTDLGTQATKQFVSDLIKGDVVFVPQEGVEENPPHKRRKQSESELSLARVVVLQYAQLHDFVRALADPYPNAFIFLPEGKLLVQKIEKWEGPLSDGVVLSDDMPATLVKKGVPLYLRLADGYALISEARFE